jgi:cyclase
VGNLEHLAQGIRAGASAVLAASIFHFKTYSIYQAKEHLLKCDIAVRMA